MGPKMRLIVMDVSAAGNSTLSRNAFRAEEMSASEKDERQTEPKCLA